MTIKQLKQLFLSELDVIYPKQEIENFFFILSDAYLGLNRVDIALNPNKEIDIKPHFHTALNSLINQKPIQYILESTTFYGLPFKVNKNVLIPRPETEELVDWIISESKNNDSDTKILDIGTGSGCIAISLAKNLTNTTVYALDVSKGALKIAEENAIANQVNIQFMEQDILNTTNYTAQFKFDSMVSNPPYVRKLEKAKMQDNVLKNEPHIALFVEDNNPLLFYDKITDFALKHLKPNGCLYFEINQYLGSKTTELLLKKGFCNVALKKDIFGRDRMVKATLQN